MNEVLVVAARRTPQGRHLGALKAHSAADLGVCAARAVLGGIPAELIDAVIIGNVLGAGLGMNVARQIGLRAGIPEAVPAFTVNQMCGSGMQSVILAAQALRSGSAEVVLCGGTESMSNAPFLLQRSPDSRRIGGDGRADSMLCDGLIDPLVGEHMGITAERLAGMYAIDREAQDAFAERSHRLYADALAAGRFDGQLVALPDCARDEHPRPGISRAQLATLQPAFSAAGTVTAGNASGINDGAAMLVLASAAAAARHGWRALARLDAWTAIGCSPQTMGLGPVHAIRALQRRSGIALESHDHVEINEAFAAQALACIGELGLADERVNKDGGAIALGHPIGASGARLLVHLSHCTASGRSRRALAALCIGGGMGCAVSMSA
jgi:acetyl-CoA C-acetyltransferase